MADLHTFARTVLFGTTLAAKLSPPPGVTLTSLADPQPPPLPAAEVPLLPGRPAFLLPGKATFPELARLHQPHVRGEVLHFFANHELLALELMALVLLRFPEAPPGFRLGLVHTMAEEQAHLRLYLARMEALGVQFGALPVSDYFWNSMKAMASPLQFVTQMSLTLEQANLDFALFYRNALTAVGDLDSAAILQRVYDDEVGHVRHGLVWFNRWRLDAPDQAQRTQQQAETEWQAYLRLLPPPMTAKRAKGLEFTPEARRHAGFSEDYIRELGLFTGSKGRPPVVWLFNPHCDGEIARGKPGFMPSLGARRLATDLAHVPAFLALDQDVLLTQALPSPEWLASVQQAGFALPEFATSLRAPKVGGIQPWGWSPDVFVRAQTLQARLTRVVGGNAPWCQQILAHETFADTGLGTLFSKAWSVRFLQAWLADHPTAFPAALPTCGAVLVTETEVMARIHALLDQGQSAMVKAPYGTAGMQVKRVQTQAELAGPLGGWLRNTLAQQGELVVERWLPKHADLSLQFEVQDDQTRLMPARRFFTGTRHEYRGAWLGRPGLDAPSLRLLHEVLPAWRLLIRDLAQALRQAGYRGPAGVDALFWKDGEGLRFKPLVELNPRWTMGRVALELEAHLAPGVEAIWAFVPVRELVRLGLTPGHYAEILRQAHPVERSRAGRLARGVVCTNDPERAREVLTVLATLPNPQVQGWLDPR